MSGWNRRGRMGTLLGDLSNQAAADASLAKATAAAEAKAAADLAELYRRQAAAAGGAGRAAQAASDAASERGRVAEQAQAAAMQVSSDFASGTVRNRPNYARTALIFGAVGLGAYFLLRRKSPRRGR